MDSRQLEQKHSSFLLEGLSGYRVAPLKKRNKTFLPISFHQLINICFSASLRTAQTAMRLEAKCEKTMLMLLATADSASGPTSRVSWSGRKAPPLLRKAESTTFMRTKKPLRATTLANFPTAQ